MGKNEIVIGIVLMILSGTMYGLTYQFPEQTIALPPTAFPRFTSTCLFILALILLIQGIINVKKPSDEQNGPKKLDKVFMIRFVLLFLLAFFYTWFLEILGYLIATALFIAGAMLIFHEKRWAWIVSVSVITSWVLYALFRIVFKIPLPRWGL